MNATATGARVARTATTATRRVNDRNIVLVLFGAVFVIVAMQGLQWYEVGAGNNVAGTGFTFADLRANADSLDAAVAQAYFDWLAVTMLVLGGAAALAANVPTPISDVLRVVGFAFGLIGTVGTYYAVAQLFDAQRAAGGSSHSVVHNSSFGLWAALIGFALITVAAALGPRR